MFWTKPNISKVYEAIGAIGDKRIEMSTDSAKMFSSSMGKFYTVTWNDDLTEMMSNDNSAFYVGQLSYPMIAVLLLKGKLTCDQSTIDALKGIKWKDINKKFKNKYEKMIEFVLVDLEQRGVDVVSIKKDCEKVLAQIENMKIAHFGKLQLPPKGY